MLLYIISAIVLVCLFIPAIWLQLTDKKETDEEKEAFRARVYARKKEKIRNVF